jgi:hypothetical protein
VWPFAIRRMETHGTLAKVHDHRTEGDITTKRLLPYTVYIYCNIYVLLVTNDFDLGSNLAEGRFMFVTSTRCIPIKIQWVEMRLCLVWVS